MLVALQIALVVATLFGPAPVSAADDPSADPGGSSVPSAEPTPTPEATPEPDATPSPEPSPTPTPTPETQSPYIVTFVVGTNGATRSRIIRDSGAEETDSIPVLRMHAILADAAALAALQADPSVLRVELDATRTAEAIPNDPGYADQWSLPQIGWDQAFGTVTPGGSAVVAILDTGVDASHGDIDANIVSGNSQLVGSTWSSDPNGHGTAMAGIVAAEADNGLGIAGVGYAGVKVMPVTVLDSSGTGQDSDVIEGVVWAVDHGADVILMAFSSFSYSASLQAAVDYAWSNDVVLVAAVGNDSSSSPAYPAGDRGVVGVSNTDAADALASSSNWGQDVFLAAPGEGISATEPGGQYGSISGTSASAAAVAAAAGLLRAVDPAASNGVIVGRLARNADAAGTVAQTGNGRLNLSRAMGDTSTVAVQPAGAAPTGSGGPFVGPYVIAAINGLLQGQSCLLVAGACSGNGTGTWIATSLMNWRELDQIPVRVLLTKSGSTSAQTETIVVNFDHTKTPGSSSFLGIENLFGWTPSANVSIVSGPTLISPPGDDVWSYTFEVSMTGPNSATTFVEFRARLAAGAHLFTGSSLAMGGSPSLGNLQIAKPGAKPGNPDLTLSKTGPSAAAPSDIITYTLNYTNKTGGTITSATGVQLRDVMPSAVTYVAGSCTPTCSVVGDTLTWDLGTLAPGATGSKSYQVTVNSGAAFGSTFTNEATIRSAENDATLTDNDSSVTTTVSFNRSPVAVNDATSTNEDTTLTVAAPGVLGNDTDADGNTLTVGTPRPVSGPSHGTLTLNANGSFTYTPAANYNGPDSFTYKANDGTVDSNTATVSITVNPVNDAPVGRSPDGLRPTRTPPSTLDGVWPMTPTSTATSLTLSMVAGPLHGTATVNANGTFTYTPAANYNGPDSFTYKANDGTLDSNTATVNITVTPVNDAPVAVNDTATHGRGHRASPSTACWPTTRDVDGRPDRQAELDQRRRPTAPLTCITAAPSGKFTYTPAANYNGPDSFTYKATDGTADSNTATVTITVTPVNDAPVAVNDTATPPTRTRR